VWSAIECFLFSLTGNTPDGYYPINGNKIFARVASYPTLRKDECKVEAHNNYIDIQVTLVGAEGIDVFDRQRMDISEPYNAENDIVFFSAVNKTPYASIINYPGYFTMLFPEEAHRPMQKPDNCDAEEPIKKVVIKVEVSCI